MKKWNDFSKMFEELNKNCDYLIVRNYEILGLSKWNLEHDDIDFLCRDLDEFIYYVGAIQMEYSDKIHCIVDVAGTNVRIDIRTIGDGYFDSLWEEEMLASKIFLNEKFYVMNTENYYYSLLYHEIYQKNELKPDYEKRLRVLAKELGTVFDKENMKKELDQYMSSKGYVETGYRSK